MLGSDFKILFDLEDRKYLPELQKLKDTINSNGCNAVCDVTPIVDYVEQVTTLKEDSFTS